MDIRNGNSQWEGAGRLSAGLRRLGTSCWLCRGPAGWPWPSVHPPLCLHLGSGNTDSRQLCRPARPRGRIGREPGILLCKDLHGPVLHFSYKKRRRWDVRNSPTSKQGSNAVQSGDPNLCLPHPIHTLPTLGFLGLLTPFPISFLLPTFLSLKKWWPSNFLTTLSDATVNMFKILIRYQHSFTCLGNALLAHLLATPLFNASITDAFIFHYFFCLHCHWSANMSVWPFTLTFFFQFYSMIWQRYRDHPKYSLISSAVILLLFP